MNPTPKPAPNGQEGLLPCPFYGSHAMSGKYGQNDIGQPLQGVWCMTCSARMFGRDSEDAYKARWNKRTPRSCHTCDHEHRNASDDKGECVECMDGKGYPGWEGKE